MSNSQSKQVVYDCYCDECDYGLTHDKLVAYFEEFRYGSNECVMTCYVLYDHCDKEYYICGKKTPTRSVMYSVKNSVKNTEYNVNEYNDFKFFCKSSKDMLKMLKCIMNVSCNDINLTILNYKDIFIDDSGSELDYIDYTSLEYSNTLQKEIISYDHTRFDDRQVKSILRMLKKVRY
jgi:hypothetical protein